MFTLEYKSKNLFAFKIILKLFLLIQKILFKLSILKVGVSILKNGCYWVTRRGTTGISCASACATFLANLEASPVGGSYSPSSIPSYYFMCSEAGDHIDAVTISFDGNTIDPAIVIASNNGNMNTTMCNCMHFMYMFLFCNSKVYADLGN